MRRLRAGLMLVLIVAGLAFVAWKRGGLEPALAGAWRADPPAPTVLFVVLDTVRADHTGLCGYSRPNTPFLEELRARGAAWTCRAYAPGSWTFPSHASYFTGLGVTEHGAHYVGQGTEIRKMTIRPLPEELPTLAEAMAARGYQTLGVSANPVLAPASGLGRGFADWRVAPAFGAWYGDRLLRQLGPALRGLDRRRPLFLFVNISDAHDPWPGVPEGVGWVPPREGRVLYFLTDPETGGFLPGVWDAFVTGALSAEEAAAERERVGDLYDYAVWKADRTLRQVVASVESHGWARAGLRLVVVSDHGEFLGEHQLLQHGHYLLEPNQRVPLLFLSTEETVALPEPVSALEAYHLVLDGRLADEPAPIEAVAFPDKAWFEVSRGKVGGSTSAAVWAGKDKLLWIDGSAARYSLGDEPLGAAEGPEAALLDALVEQVKASAAREFASDPALIEALRAAGYLE